MFNQKKDRVIHHGTHTPITNTVPENVEEVNSKVPTPCVPTLSSSIFTNSAEIDPKQPDSSNGGDATVDQTLQSEICNLLPENPNLLQVDIPTELQDTSKKNVETTDATENIQVDEISSSDILEETTESENKGADETIPVQSVNLEDGKKQIAEQNENQGVGSDDMQIPIQSNSSKSEEFTELKQPKEPLPDERAVCNMMRQDPFLGAKEASEDGQPISFESKPRRSNASVPVETNSFSSSEVRNSGVLNGSKHKQQQHPLFPVATSDFRTVKKRHSLNSQTPNAYVDVASSDPKTYVSIKSRYKVSTTKTSIAGNMVEENMLKNTSNRQMNSSGTMSNKRRHSTIAQANASTAIEDSHSRMQQQQEPCTKRRTRSEDRPSHPADENDPANQAIEDASSRLSWPMSESAMSRNNGANATLSGQDKLSSSNTFQRRSLGKKATPVKTIRRPSINGSNRLQQLRGSFGLRDWDQGRNNRASNCNDRRLNRTVAIIGATDTTISQRWLRLVDVCSLQIYII